MKKLYELEYELMELRNLYDGKLLDEVMTVKELFEYGFNQIKDFNSWSYLGYDLESFSDAVEELLRYNEEEYVGFTENTLIRVQNTEYDDDGLNSIVYISILEGTEEDVNL